MVKQSRDVRVAQFLTLRQALKLLQQFSPHASKPATEPDMAVAEHAELQDWKSFSHTRTLWLPGPQGDWVGLID
jgi:hypothetical protein